jgi:hypothetical protein
MGICIRSDFCQRHIRYLRGRGVPDNWRYKKQAKGTGNSEAIPVRWRDSHSFACDIGSDLLIIWVLYRAILGRGQKSRNLNEQIASNYSADSANIGYALHYKTAQ